jgi:hypothetical protein
VGQQLKSWGGAKADSTLTGQAKHRAGAYMLEFGNYFLENIVVQAGQEVVLEP